MNKFIAIVVLMVIACTDAKPAIVAPAAAIAYSAPLVAAAAPLPFVTATSSQVVSRNYNAAYVASPAVFAAPSPYIASAAAPFAYPSPYSPYSLAAAPVLL